MLQEASPLRRRLLEVDDPDVRALQIVFTLLFVLDFVLRFVGAAGVALRSWPTVGLVLALVLTVFTLVRPVRPRTTALVALLPLLDLAALGLGRLNQQATGAGILAIVPALWLGRQLGRRGAVIAGAGTVLLVSVPALVYFGVDGITVSRSLLIPVVTTWAGLAIASALEKMRAASDVAEGRGHELNAALGTIDYQQRFSEAILDTVDVGLVLLDERGAYLTMNRRHQAFMDLAYPSGHAGMAGQLGLVYAEDGKRPLVREEMPTYRASQGEEFDDFRMWIGDDPVTNRAVSVSARTVKHRDGSFGGAALAYNDVTDFMRALQVKDEFVASVSHELRTPLTSIVGYVNILEERDDLPTDVHSHLSVVSRNTTRLQRLVADLLHTAQVDEGPMQVRRVPTDLSKIVRDAVEAATPAAAASGITIHAEMPERLEVMVDAQRMAQVVDNLISNAIKYSPDGGRVDVCLALDGGKVELAVKDTGLGIESSDRDRLFTRFFRSAHATKQSIQGVGLGLSITKSIVESHGGRIEVESELGRGSEFRVRIPRD